MMTSNNNTAAKIPMRSLRMVCAAVSTILMFLKWFRVDIGGIAQLFLWILLFPYSICQALYRMSTMNTIRFTALSLLCS